MWNTFKAEFHALWKSRIRFASWILLLFMPLIYGMLFLSSFWSPFKNTNKLPIIVVNLDQGSASINLENKLRGVENQDDPSKDLVLSGGSSDYKIHVTDATDLYKTKNEVEEAVNSGKYSAAFVIPADYSSKVSEITTQLGIDFISGNVNLDSFITKLRTTLASGGLIDFYNSFKMSYVAGEMTNMGSSLYKLIGDILFPDTSMLKPIIQGIEQKLPAIIGQLAQSQTKHATQVATSIINGIDPSIIKSVIAQVLPMVNSIGTTLTPVLAKAPALAAELQGVVAKMNALSAAPDAAVHPALVTAITDGLSAINTEIHNLNVDQLLPLVNAIKTRVLEDMSGGDIMVNHKTYGKQEGISGKHDILNTYGYGLSPYFLSIVLWAGALLMIFLFPNKRYIKTEGTMKNLAGKTAVWILTGWIQVLLLFAIISIPGIFGTLTYHIDGHAVVIKQCINIGAGQWKLILFALFISTMFMLIVRGIVYTLRVADIGLFLCVILLILQLVSSGGTFPVSMQPPFFKFLHKILPFTYTVEAFREMYWDTDALVVLKDFGILMIIPAIFTATSIASGLIWDHKTKYVINGKTYYRSMDKNVGSL